LSEAQPAAVVLRGVGKTFADGTWTLDGIDLSVRRGELVAVVGPSGCGKSTLLRLAAGLEEPTAGTVEVDRQKLAFIFQEATLLPWRRVLANVELLGELRDLPKDVRRQRAAEALELVGLQGFEAHYPRQLSGGMKMRVSLARALVTRPEVFLFDEPFAALDEISRERLQGEARELFARERFAGMFVTHSIPEAVFLATRVLVLSARPGRVVASFEVPFGAERPGSLRFEPEFARLAGRVRSALEDAS
jgi:NitT/TauT family transport system ATP-binding protein